MEEKSVVGLLLGFCFGSLFFMQTQYTRILALAKLQSHLLQKPNKIAFLFIARNRLPLDMVWDAFFKGEESRFSIFVHSRPGFLRNKATTRSNYFMNRQVNDSIQVDWGEASMIEAERILLRHALEDPRNERLVFLSDSCIPLYNFSYTYDYIMSTSTSFVDWLVSQVVHLHLNIFATRSLTHSSWDISSSKDPEAMDGILLLINSLMLLPHLPNI